MKIRLTLALALTLLFPLTTLANSVYQCTENGVTTFSQTPCDDQYNTIDVNVSSGGNIKQVDNTQACLSHITAKHVFEYPETIQVASSQKIWITDKSGARQVLILELRARKNTGAYGATKPYRCFLNHDGTQLSKVQYVVK